MLRTTLKNLGARKLRLLTTSLAVLLGVAFMAGTLVLTDTIGKQFDGLFAEANAGTDAYVRGDAAFDDEMLGDQRARVDASLVETFRGIDGVADAVPYIEGYAQLVDDEGDPIGDPNMGAPVLGGIWSESDGLNPYDLVDGAAPVDDNDVVIDKGSADTGSFEVGESVTVLTHDGPQQVDVTGIATFAGEDSPGGASVTMFTSTAAQALLTEPGQVDAIQVAAADGVSQSELVSRIEAAVPGDVEVLTGAEITAEQQADIKDDMSFFNVFLMVFAVIALFVGSFIIYNSFSILVAQRSKEMALFRAIGASKRQVLGSVLLEAVAVGLIASIVGLAAGVGVAALLKAMLGAMGIDIPAGDVVISSRTVIMSVIAGLGVSVASAVFPARKAAKVAPIEAMRDVAIDHSGNSRKRAVIGLSVIGVGAAAMVAVLWGGAGAVLLAIGVPAVFIGVAILGPVLAGPMSRVIGWPLPRVKGMAGNLARENAMRNPKRTSATAAALMIGVALVGFITILASSTKASIDETMAESFNGDLVVTAGAAGMGGLSPDVARQLSDVPEVGAVTGLRMAPAEVDGHGTALTAADPAAMNRIVDIGVTDGSVEDLSATDIGVLDDKAEANGWAVGDTIPVRFVETGVQQFHVAAIYTEGDLTGEYLISTASYDANMADRFDLYVVASFADGVSAADGRQAVEAITDGYPQAEVQDRDEFIEAKGAQVDAMLNLIYVLLALAVFIALLGIANTLALSIFERTRELGLLRAVGMTRRQLRATVRWEAVIISLLGTTLGLAIGISFGWAMVTALKGEGLGAFTIPVNQLAVVTVIAALAGVAAAILPARRAARMDVLGAIVSD
jgi:putative ABC transport system permease protein